MVTERWQYLVPTNEPLGLDNNTKNNITNMAIFVGGHRINIKHFHVALNFDTYFDSVKNTPNKNSYLTTQLKKFDFRYLELVWRQMKVNPKFDVIRHHDATFIAMRMEVEALERYKKYLNSNLIEAEEKSLKMNNAALNSRLILEDEKKNKEEEAQDFRKDDSKNILGQILGSNSQLINDKYKKI